jgi:hypothetical protein
MDEAVTVAEGDCGVQIESSARKHLQVASGASLPIIGKTLGHKDGSPATAIYARLNLDARPSRSAPMLNHGRWQEAGRTGERPLVGGRTASRKPAAIARAWPGMAPAGLGDVRVAGRRERAYEPIFAGTLAIAASQCRASLRWSM